LNRSKKANAIIERTTKLTINSTSVNPSLLILMLNYIISVDKELCKLILEVMPLFLYRQGLTIINILSVLLLLGYTVIVSDPIEINILATLFLVFVKIFGMATLSISLDEKLKKRSKYSLRLVLNTNVYIADALNPQNIIYKIVEDSATQYLAEYYKNYRTS